MTYPETVREILLGDISVMSECPQNFSNNPEKDFTRLRKIGFETTVRMVVAMEGGTINHEILKWFDYDTNAPTASAFCQQRNKLHPDLFRFLLLKFNSHYATVLHKGVYQLMACDGSEFNIARNPDDQDTFHPPSGKSTIGFNMLHMVAAYDLLGRRYLNAVIQPGRKKNEYRAVCDLIDGHESENCSTILICDRGFASYNTYAHAIEKGMLFLIRCKDSNMKRLLGIKSLDNHDEFDCNLRRVLTRTHSRKKWTQPEKSDEYRVICKDVAFDYIESGSEREYEMSLRVVRFRLSNGSYESIVTNLPPDEFRADEIKRLYNMRWGIETSFRELKHTIGAVSFHSKKADYIKQEIWARLILYNFCEIITVHVEIEHKDTKHSYQVNYTMAIKVCHYYFRLPQEAIQPDVESLIKRCVLPIRPNRQYPRRERFQKPTAFGYRFS